jgi:hypothetical protein
MMRAARKPRKWKPSPPELVERFDAAVGSIPVVVRRKMFGYPAAFASGHLFTGLHEHRWIVRLDEAGRAALKGEPFEPMRGRVMKEYAVLPAGVDPRPWIERALRYVRGLPPK